MKRHKTLIAFFSIFILLSLSLIVLSNGVFWNKKPPVLYRVSLIVGGKTGESWSAIEQGVAQAAADLKTEVTTVYLSKDGDAQEQAELLSREVENGADAVLIAPVDSKTLMEPIRKATETVPVVQLESRVEEMDGVPFVNCQNRELGAALASRILSQGSPNVALVRRGLHRSSVSDRFGGAEEALKAAGAHVVYWDIPADQEEALKTIKILMQGTTAGEIAAFDALTLDLLAQAKKELSTGAPQVSLYGVGSSGGLVSYLEEGVISALGVQNEFNIGYVGMMEAVAVLGGSRSHNTSIDFSIVNSDEVYTKENQRLLFPFAR